MSKDDSLDGIMLKKQKSTFIFVAHFLPRILSWAFAGCLVTFPIPRMNVPVFPSIESAHIVRALLGVVLGSFLLAAESVL